MTKLPTQPLDNHRENEKTPDCTSGDCNCTSIGRRDFIRLAGLSAASVSALGGLSAIAGPFEAKDVADHFVPVDKKLAPKWIKTLFAKGERTFYEGDDLKTIAMPVGGIGAGQLYLAGDGRLTHWDIFNRHDFTGYGRTNYEVGRGPKPMLEQGFAIHVQSGGKSACRSLDAQGFPGVRFAGEYPIGMVEYRDLAVPVAVTLEAFSPFVPLDAFDSALPATVMQFTLKNTSSSPVEVTLAGWLENGVASQGSQTFYGMRRNRIDRSPGCTMVVGSARKSDPPSTTRPTIVLADFEGDNYNDWTVEGKAFGTGPAAGTIGRQQEVSGFAGKGLVNTFIDGDEPLGKLTSPEFKIDRSFLCFLIGGGADAGATCINLLVDGEVARTATGKRNEKLEHRTWDVRDLVGKSARIEIVDAASGPWGHVNIDQIELRDTPGAMPQGELAVQPDVGTMGLAVLGESDSVLASEALPDGPPAEVLFDGNGSNGDGNGSVCLSSAKENEKSFGRSLIGAVGKTVTLGPGEQAQVTFLVSWCFRNRPENGNLYAMRFPDAPSVARYVTENFERLAGETRQWHATWYDSSLPHWLLDRLFSTVSTLATSTCQWWANGRFWGWEGVGCCRGTCTHVWNYEHALARLFPQLERSTREMQDFNPEAGFVEETGMVRFRGENWDRWAGDGQAGTVLKAYREHLVSADDGFLKRNWPRIKKTLEFLINEDGNNDGLLEAGQHNTYDIDFHGANTMIGSLYLAALAAGREMAELVGDAIFVKECSKIIASGSRLSVEKLFNGEYFIQEVDLEKHPKSQYGDGCLADQLFGQGWAAQVGLGDVYPKETILATLQAIWKYNWAPDIGPQNEAHPPGRWFARPGEAGLFTCTWPKSPHLPDGVRYKNEVWTGIEYQVAGNMAWEGMVTEALAICRGVHERYHPSKHNPFNEVECGDHYARGMASYGVFLGLCGFEYDGPAGAIGFAPRITPDDFRAAFTAATGWGTISQKREAGKQSNHIEVAWGQLRAKSLRVELPEGAVLAEASVRVDGKPVSAKAESEGNRVTLTLSEAIVLKQNEIIEVEITT